MDDPDEDTEYTLPEGMTLASELVVSRQERRNEIARRIAGAMAELGYRATRKDIAARAGVTVATLRRYIGPSRSAPDPEGRVTVEYAKKALRAAEKDRRERQGWHPDQQRLGLRQPRRVGCESSDLAADWT
jgi:DNA-binding LacI/PurR family transcriptional regulator